MIVSRAVGGPHILKHGSLEIPFQIDFVPRKQLTIHVHPEMRLEVLAPEGKEVSAVFDRIEARVNWIAKQWRHFERYQPCEPARLYVSGETYVYLGRQYRLKIRQGQNSSVKLKGRFLHVEHSKIKDRDALRLLVESWYTEHAKAMFESRLAYCLERCASLKLESTPHLLVRSMKRRWGSCTRKGTITLNTDLVKTPVHCIDYVIVHELCHLKIHDHSPAFYRLLSRLMPDWSQKKARLDSQVWGNGGRYQ
jgi:predicted metal-dependent hydrolase